MAGTITLLLPKHIFFVHCLTRIVYTGFWAANHKYFSQSEVPITQAPQPIRGCQAANQRLPITLALQPIRGYQSLMHFSQSEAANHPSTSDSQRLPITQELSQSEDSYHSSISATQAENHLCTSANHAVNHSSTSANQNITHTILHEKPKECLP